MTSDAKIGLLLGLVLIFVIAFILNGLPNLRGHEDSNALTTEMMDVVKFMRDYYQRHQAFPVVRAVCKNVHQPKDCTYDRFPDPIVAWKVAGLPKPNSEVFARVKHEAWPSS